MLDDAAARTAAAGAPDDRAIPTARRRRCPTASAACPAIDAARCAGGLPRAASRPVRPARIARGADGAPRIDLGRCLFCARLRDGLPDGRARVHAATTGWPRATREDLGRRRPATLRSSRGARRRSCAQLFGRSLKLRQVSAGGCNACEADTNVLGTVGCDLGRFGIQFVASPRHADGLLITGPVTAEHAPGPAEDLRGRARAEDRHRRRRLRHLRRPVRRPPRGARRRRRRSCRSTSTSPAARRTR